MDDKQYKKHESDGDNPALVLARKIVFDQFIENFRKHRVATKLERDILDEADGLRDYLIDKDTRTFCILSVSFMEDVLKRRFSEQWAITNATDESLYFGSNGSLSTFSQRLAVAKGIGWIGDAEFKQASILRKIRNHLAHDHRVHQIDRDPLVGLAESLRPLERIWCNGMQNYKESYDSAPKSTILKMRVYCNSIQIVSMTLVRSKLIAVHLPPDMRDGTGYDSLTEVEQCFIDHTVRHCFKSLDISL